MNTRLPANQKFFRRTSKSPWEQARAPISPDPEALCLQLAHSTLSTTIPRITTDRQKQCSISIANIPDDNSPDIATVKNIPDSGSQKLHGSDKFNRNIGQYRTNGKSNDQIKFTYIPIESMSTLHTLPATQKKISDFSQSIKSYVSTEQFNSLRKQLDKVNDELRQSNQKQKQKTNENMKLQKQLETVKRNNHTLEIENKKIREGLYQVERNYKLSQINMENCKKNLDVQMFRRQRAQQCNKQLSQNALKMQMQLRPSRQRNSELIRLLQMKQNQIIGINGQLERQVKKAKSLLQISQQADPRALRQRSITYYESNQQQNRQPQQKLKQTQKQPKLTHKCSRYIQTESNNLQRSLKQIENLSSCLQSKMKNINQLRCQLQELSYKVKDFDIVTQKLGQYEILIQDLNQKIMKTELDKLACKYRFY